MASARRRSRPLRSVVRTFFAHRFWLVAMVMGASLAAALLSMRQPKTFVGRMELASASDAHSTPVILPDVVRLRQLVFNPENLAALANGEARDAKLVSRIAKSVQLEPVSDPALGSGVWRLRVEIPAADAATAAERLDRYAQRIDEEFRQRVALAKKEAAPTADAADSQLATVGHAQANQDEETFADPLAEIGDDPADIHELASAIQANIDRASAELDRKSMELDAIAAVLKQLEGSPTAVSAPIEADQPALRALRNERDRLLEQRARLAAYLKPAHPDYLAIDRRIQSAEAALAEECAKLVELYRTKQEQVESSIASLQAQLGSERRRLDAVQRRFPANVATPLPRTAASNSEAPRPLPDVAARSLDYDSVPKERPIGRVVLPSPAVDPAPIQPTTVRNALLAALAALVLYAVFVVIRAGADTRIHSMDELEDLGLDIYAFGSIPSLRSGGPVRLRAIHRAAVEPRS